MPKFQILVREEGSSKDVMQRTFEATDLGHVMFEVEKARRAAQEKFGTDAQLLFHHKQLSGQNVAGYKAYTKKDEAIFVNYQYNGVTL